MLTSTLLASLYLTVIRCYVGLIGVSLKVLTELAERAGSEWTVQDLLDNIIRPETSSRKKSYAETLKGDQTSDDFIFISAPRASNFKDLVCIINDTVDSCFVWTALVIPH